MDGELPAVSGDWLLAIDGEVAGFERDEIEKARKG